MEMRREAGLLNGFFSRIQQSRDPGSFLRLRNSEGSKKFFLKACFFELSRIFSKNYREFSE